MTIYGVLDEKIVDRTNRVGDEEPQMDRAFWKYSLSGCHSWIHNTILMVFQVPIVGLFH
jgi:hypothetical protein